MKNFLLVGWAILLTACTAKNHTAPEGMQYARYFSMTDSAGFRKITVEKPFPGGKPQTYYIKKGQTSGDTLAVPVRRYAATSVTYLEMLKNLGVLDGLKGFAGLQYVSDPEIIRRAENGKIRELGPGDLSSPETLLALKPEVIFVFSTGNDGKNFTFLRRYGITPVYVSEWMETHPLGRAEWIKFFGAFFDKDSRADSIFAIIESRYTHARDSIKQLHHRKKPRVFQGALFGDKWYVPGGESWAARLIRDAGGEYLIKDRRTDSRIISHEDALLLLSQADIWINTGMQTSLDELKKAFPAAEKLPVFRSGRIYSPYIKLNEKGKNVFFERSVLRPDRVLRDLINIFDGNCNDCYFYRSLK